MHRFKEKSELQLLSLLDKPKRIRRWVEMKNFFDFWENMSEDQRKIYYYLMLTDLDRLIPKSDARIALANAISEKYCRHGKCPFDYPCCRQCIVDGSRCNRWSRPNVCNIWFCDYVLDKLNKFEIKLMMFRKVSKKEREESRKDKFSLQFGRNQKYTWRILDILNKKAPPPESSKNKIWLVQLPTRDWTKEYYKRKGMKVSNKIR